MTVLVDPLGAPAAGGFGPDVPPASPMARLGTRIAPGGASPDEGGPMVGAFEKSPGRAPLGSSRPMFRAGSRFAITISIAESLATFAGPVGAARGGTTNGKFMRLVWPASVGAPGTVDAIPVGAPF